MAQIDVVIETIKSEYRKRDFTIYPSKDYYKVPDLQGRIEFLIDGNGTDTDMVHSMAVDFFIYGKRVAVPFWTLHREAITKEVAQKYNDTMVELTKFLPKPGDYEYEFNPHPIIYAPNGLMRGTVVLSDTGPMQKEITSRNGRSMIVYNRRKVHWTTMKLIHYISGAHIAEIEFSKSKQFFHKAQKVFEKGILELQR